jgi:hypothetical protein
MTSRNSEGERMVRKICSSGLLAILVCSLGCNSPRTDKVDAGFFQKVGYAPKPHLMTVYFTDGSVYSYENVPEQVYKQLLRAASPGSFFNKSIRDSYHSELIHIRTTPLAKSRFPQKTAPPKPSFECSQLRVNRRAVKSVILDSVAYDAGDNCMILYFDRGYVYEYGGVPPGVFDALVHAPNIDKFFNKKIWGKYPDRQIKRSSGRPS